jgi:hypothetical protein
MDSIRVYIGIFLHGSDSVRGSGGLVVVAQAALCFALVGRGGIQCHKDYEEMGGGVTNLNPKV